MPTPPAGMYQPPAGALPLSLAVFQIALPSSIRKSS